MVRSNHSDHRVVYYSNLWKCTAPSWPLSPADPIIPRKPGRHFKGRRSLLQHVGRDAAALLAKAFLSAHDSLPPLHQPTPVALQEITYDQFTEKEINSFICPSYLGKDGLKKKKKLKPYLQMYMMCCCQPEAESSSFIRLFIINCSLIYLILH